MPRSSVSVFVTERITAIHSLKGIGFILTGELGVIHYLSNSFSSRYHNYFLEFLQPSTLSKVISIFLTLKFAAIQLGQRTFFHRETNLLSKQLYFPSNIDYVGIIAATWGSYFFAERFFSEYLLVWSSYVFLITASW